MKLTPKQEAFAQAIADGMTQADAYRTAFNVKPTTKPQSIWDSASKVIANPEVAQRVAELKDKLEKKALWSREMSVKALVKSYQLAEKGQNPQAMTGAIKEINAMHGFNAPQKIDISAELTLQRIERVIVKA
jgi:hypothetical protein